MTDKNKNYIYIDNIKCNIKINEKLHRDESVIKIGEEIKNYYIEKLKENDCRIFAKYDVSKYVRYSQFDKKSCFEAQAFCSHFYSYFKSKSKVRFKRDVVSCFALELKDRLDNDYYTYFCVDKKEYELRNDEYLNEVFNYFKNEIDIKIKNKRV